MQKDTPIREYPLFVGLTRPPMIFGVTQTFLVLSFMPCMIFFIITYNLIFAAAIYLVLHLFGYICCYKDTFTFHILLGKLELVCPNRSYWGCNSYDPS